jgi:hypothetical protein
MDAGYIVQDFARPQSRQTVRQSECCVMGIGKMCNPLCNACVNGNKGRKVYGGKSFGDGG